MDKPKDFDNVQAFTTFTPLTAGGHICRIAKVEEATSRTHKPMIVIYLDTDSSDSQPNYFSSLYKNDTRPDRKWSNSAIVRQLVYDAEGNTNRGYKTFIEMVEHSNPGFKVQWGDNFCTSLKNKLVGGLFGKEEYLDNYGNSKFATRCFNFRTVEDIKNGVEAPKDKLLNSKNNQDDFIPINDDYMPF